MKSIHFVGVCGIGMSGLAAAACDMGIEVTGSDRGAERPENRHIAGPLQKQGVRIYPQDGSRFTGEADMPDVPDVLVYSTAIEEDNPDFKAAGNLPRLHRSALLKELLARSGKRSIAVTGSCGKSTVCCYMAEALDNLNCSPAMLAGALDKRFRSETLAGNYAPGKGEYLVFEADESDKSLLNYGADYAIILNIGTDHYDKAELARVFAEFLRQIRCGAVMTSEVFAALKAQIPAHLQCKVVAMDEDEYADIFVRNYQPEPDGTVVTFSDGCCVTLPKSGRHMAINALCIKAMLEMLAIPASRIPVALERFAGVWRRDDFTGYAACGARVFDDYAHNPEKILSCLTAMRERCSGNIYAVFQPHGYGPFGFMEEQLFEYMEKFLKTEDRFILLEPFYAGGTSSFSPTADEVWRRWIARSSEPGRFITMPSRDELKTFLNTEAGSDDLIVIMGARDNSLNDFAGSL